MPVYNIYKGDKAYCHDGEYHKVGQLPDSAVDFNFREAAVFMLRAQEETGDLLQAKMKGE